MTKEDVVLGLYDIKNWKCHGDSKTPEVVTAAIQLLERPEIITCENCRYWKNAHLCEKLSKYGPFDTAKDFFCGYAERREETKQKFDDPECKDCEAYEYNKNGIHARCPKTGIYDFCERLEQEDKNGEKN